MSYVDESKGSTMTRVFTAAAAFLAIFTIALVGVAGGAERESAATPTIQVYANPSWGCCGAWNEHLRANGFRVNPVPVQDPGEYRRRYGIPEDLGSCHTGVVEGYALEGHVPAREVKRLLAERPKARGLAVPGMPIGAPGMEGGKKQPFDVLLVLPDGKHVVYARYGR
jgi:hypothetical protein